MVFFPPDEDGEKGGFGQNKISCPGGTPKMTILRGRKPNGGLDKIPVDYKFPVKYLNFLFKFT